MYIRTQLFVAYVKYINTWHVLRDFRAVEACTQKIRLTKSEPSKTSLIQFPDSHLPVLMLTILRYIHVLLLSISLALNSRDRKKSYGFQKICTLKTTFLKSQRENQLQLYWYNTNNAITSSKYVAKCC